MIYGLSRQTADQVAQLVRERKRAIPPPLVGTARDRTAAMVKCTSATAAAGSGVGAQCYPGVIIDPDANDTTQSSLGNVWLTLLDSDSTVGTPTADKVYSCLLAGDVDASGGGDVRPRAFGQLPVSSGSSGLILAGATANTAFFNPIAVSTAYVASLTSTAIGITGGASVNTTSRVFQFFFTGVATSACSVGFIVYSGGAPSFGTLINPIVVSAGASFVLTAWIAISSVPVSIAAACSAGLIINAGQMSVIG